jgi:hypothetical protein
MFEGNADRLFADHTILIRVISCPEESMMTVVSNDELWMIEWLSLKFRTGQLTTLLSSFTDQERE